MTTRTWVVPYHYHYSQHVQQVSVDDECLLQLFYGAVWDGDLKSKAVRDILVSKGFADRVAGWNFVTLAGISYLLQKELIRP